MKDKNIQVDSNHYNFLEYERISRFSSYFYQLKTTMQLKPNNILEIGKGSGIYSTLLKKNGFDIDTCDYDEALKPDIVGDVRKLPLNENSYDCICVFQVLEHLPFTDFKQAIKELTRVSKKYVFISLPDAGRYIKIDLWLPKIGGVKKMISIAKFKRDIHKYDGEHYWELNKIGFEEEKINKILTMDESWKLTINHRLFENPYHRFYLLEKQE